MRVTIWNENIHEQYDPAVTELYPGGIYAYIKSFLEEEGIEVCTTTLEQPEDGLPQELLDNTDVLLWWGHVAHDRVSDETARRVQAAVLGGMGLIVLHSGHHSKVFRLLMGTTCNLKWRNGARERVWTVKPSHPIACGVEESFVLEPEEMYGEPFDIPNPDDVVFMGWFNGGEVFRSGCTWTRGNGRIFYFQPGHETNPSYRNHNVQRILRNAVRWACPTVGRWQIPVVNAEPLEG